SDESFLTDIGRCPSNARWMCNPLKFSAVFFGTFSDENELKLSARLGPGGKRTSLCGFGFCLLRPRQRLLPAVCREVRNASALRAMTQSRNCLPALQGPAEFCSSRPSSATL